MNITKRFWKYCNAGEDIWKLITSNDKTSVFKHKDKDFCYRIESIIDNTPATVMSEIYNIKNRPKWDHDLEKSYVIEQVSPYNRIYYIQTKSVLICSARDFVTKI